MISAVIKFEDNRVSIHSSATKNVGTQFTPGFYKANTDNNGNLVISESKLEEIHDPNPTQENIMVLKTVESFFADGILEKVRKLGYIHKLGVLLFGRAGTGKTSLLNFIAQRLVDERGAIVFFCENGNGLSAAIHLAGMIREIQDSPIIFIGDEFERYAHDAESEMKNLLDGNNSINNSLFLAATNYIEKVPDTLKKRPSRFKVVLDIKGITDKTTMANTIRNISERIQPGLFTEKEIEEEVKKLEDVTLDEIKQLCLDKLTNNYLPPIVVRKSIGFGKNTEEEVKSNTAWYSIGGLFSPSSKSKIKEGNSNI